jgi:glycosyltransferase involved in cell wall biosynthesis
VTVFTDEPAGPDGGLPTRATGEFVARQNDFDIPLYHMGNSAWHASTYDTLTRYPGVVVLHDYFLHHFMRHHIAGRGDWRGYGRELAYALGRDGRGLSEAIHTGRAAAPLFDEPLNRRVLDSAVGLIVHSEFAAARARAARPELAQRIVPAPIEIRPGRSRRAELDIADDAVLFAIFGQLTAEKQIEPALRAFAAIGDDYPAARFLLAGEARPDVDVEALVAELGLAGRVHYVGYVADLAAFVDWIHTADVVINLRQPTVGETSAVALRAMAAARPLIVYDHGWYGELPDAVALRPPPGDADALRAAMEQLAAAPELRAAMGRAGLAYARRQADPRRVARAYVDFLHSLLTPFGTAHD